jgi:hypothetical protein
VAKPLIEGQTVDVTTTFRDKTGKVFDPFAVRFNIEDSKGAVTVYTETTRLKEGVYSQEFVLTSGNTWWFRNEGLDSDGNVIAVDQEPFEVESKRPFK